MSLSGPKTSMIFKRNTGTTTDGMSDAVLPAWTTVCTVNGIFGAVRGDEKVIAGQDTVVATHKIAVDYVATTTGTVTTDDQVTIAGLDYEILMIDNAAMANKLLRMKLKRVDI